MLVAEPRHDGRDVDERPATAFPHGRCERPDHVQCSEVVDIDLAADVIHAPVDEARERGEPRVVDDDVRCADRASGSVDLVRLRDVEADGLDAGKVDRRRAGCSPRALRYYEEQGLLAPQRTQGGQRRYPVDAVERVLLYRRLIDAGLGTEVIRELLPCMNGSAGADTVATLEREHAKLLDQARELEATADRLADILKSL